MSGTVIYVIGSILLITCLIGILFLTKGDKLSMLVYKINMCENDIDKNLNQKEEATLRLISIIERQLNISLKDFDDVKNLKSTKPNNVEKDKVLTNAYIQIMKIYVDNPKLEEVKSFDGMLKDIDNDEMAMISLRTLYNKCASEFNNINKNVINNIICKFKKYDVKPLYDGKELHEVIEKELDNLVI